jgi:hypothetical protein
MTTTRTPTAGQLRATCVNKVGHATHAAALRAKRHADSAIYRCGFCGQFHIGTGGTDVSRRDRLRRLRLDEIEADTEAWTVSPARTGKGAIQF